MRKKRTPWPRWAKILKNLLLAALLGFLMWDLWDQPTLSYTADLRRRERQMLVPEAETVVELNTAGSVKYRIELADNVAVTSYPAHGKIFTNANVSFHRLEEGPDLLCVSHPVELPDEWGQPLTYAAYVAVRPPEDSVDAVLTLHIDGEDYVAEGVREGDIFIFYARPEPDEDRTVFMGSNWFFLGQFTYEVQFFDADGTVVGQISG